MAKVYKSVNRELTIFGVERKLMLVPACGWILVLWIRSNFAASVAVALVLYVVCRITTARDPRIGNIFLNVCRLKRAYDPLNPSRQRSRKGPQMALRARQPTGAVHELLNFHSFTGPDLLLTKFPELGMFLRLKGIDPECLEEADIERTVHAYREAMRQVLPGIRVCIIRLKTAGPKIPRQDSYTNDAAGRLVANHVDGVQKRAGKLYEEEIYIGFFLPIPAAVARAAGIRTLFSKQKCFTLYRKAYETYASEQQQGCLEPDGAVRS